MNKNWVPDKEVDMSQPIISYFKSKGFVVHAEIVDRKGGIIDHIAKRRGNLTAIELKLNCNLQLLFQGLRNTWYCDYSYICFPFTGKYVKRASPELAKIKYLCEKLGIGIIKYGQKSKLNPNYEHILPNGTKVYISEWLPAQKNSPKDRDYIIRKCKQGSIDKIGGVSYNNKRRKRKGK